MNIKKHPGEDNFVQQVLHIVAPVFTASPVYIFTGCPRYHKPTHNKKQHVLQPQQSGFRLHHSTVTTTTAVVDDIVNRLDKKQHCAALFVDQSKAFDTVHDMLFSERLCVFFYVSFHICSRLYFSDRVQTVADEGAPQGSILCPLLFTVYIL